MSGYVTGLGDGPDLARGEGNVETSSSSEDEDSEEEAEEQGKNDQYNSSLQW